MSGRKTRTITVLVTAEVPAEVSVTEWKSYVTDAVASMKGSRHPYDDPLFDLNGDTVVTSHAKVLRGKKQKLREPLPMEFQV